MQDSRGQLFAQLKLGLISQQRGEYLEGKENFQKALSMANEKIDINTVEIAKCGYAISCAETQMEDFLNDYANKLNN